MQAPDLTALATQLNSVSIHLVRRARTADATLGVPPGQLSALSVLVFGGERTIAQLAEAEAVTSPTMTRIVDGLEHAGLAERRPHPRDARATIVRPTRAGRQIMERGRRQRVEVITALLGHLSDAELRVIQRAADAVSDALTGEIDSTRR